MARHADLPATLIYSDVHLKNWYRAPDGRMGLSDWGCVCVGHWSRDVSYAMATAMSVEQRRAWERDLLAYYLERLRAHGAPAVSFDDALVAYRQQLLGALAWWTATLTPLEGTMPDMQPAATTMTWIHRIATAIDDLDALDAFAEV